MTQNLDRFAVRAWNAHLKHKPRRQGAPCFRIYEQCTGLRDKNDALIFEGDIVELIDGGCAYRAEIKWVPEWHCLGAVFENNNKEMLADIDGYVSIVGNIHDNPELMIRYKVSGHTIHIIKV